MPPRSQALLGGNRLRLAQGRASTQRRAGGRLDSGFLLRESQSRGRTPASTELSAFAPAPVLSAQSQLGGSPHPSYKPAVSAHGGDPPGLPPKAALWGSSTPGPLSRDNEDVSWGQNCLGSIYACGCLRGWRGARLEAPRNPEAERLPLQWDARSLVSRDKLLSYGARLRTTFSP